ncbi:muts domain V-domain-containing protein [Dipodascopsis tothii]|uniref:muts domain V-domain-containing protein n=1 Tax=Dipodascopsis tothii TaxID=44089 RepID=UPI0034CD83B6
MPSHPELHFSDRTDEYGFLSFFRGLEPNDPAESGTVRVFERGDYYTCHGKDALFVAQKVYRTLSVIKYLGSQDPAKGVASCTLSPAVFTNFLKDALLAQGLKVEIYAASGKNNWAVSKHASPGNLQAVEDLLQTATTAPVIMAVRLATRADQKVVGVCFADASVRELGVSEFVDNDLYSNLEALVIQLGVRECVVVQDEARKDYELKKLRALVDRCDVVLTERRAAEFSTRDVEQDLGRLLGGESPAALVPQTALKTAMAATAALVRYLGLMSDPLNFGHYRLYEHNLADYMKLDASALRALHLMPGPRDGAKSMSIFGLLNRCRTAAGTRLLAQWLKQPLMDLDAITARHVLVETFVEDIQLRQTLQEDHLRAVPDLHRLAKKFQRGAATLEDVVRVYQLVIRIPDFVATLESVVDEKYQRAVEDAYTSRLQDFYDNLVKLQEMVETTVDLDALDNHEFVIKPDFDERLQEIRGQLAGLQDRIADAHADAGADLGMEPDKKLKLENHHVYGWCLRLTRNDAACLRNNRAYVELSTQKAGVYFTTAALRDMSSECGDLTRQYNKLQNGLVREVVAIAATYCVVLEKLAGVLAHLDVVVAFAHVAANAPTPFVRPTMRPRGTGSIVLAAARHPCMEAQDDVVFIPNDVALVRGQSEFLTITGPNMGGKSTYIRQVGVIALMAQAGCFVPAAEAELSVVDSILARVGAGDSQLKGISTFMAEMLETASILKTATADSLIIIDELGRGTSTYDGFGLAWAISQHIVEHVRCFAMFATHFHELTALAGRFPQVQNLHVVAHVDPDAPDAGRASNSDITLLYKVEPGVSDQSFGIHVAELVRFPPKVIAMAKRKADELADDATPHPAAKCSKTEIADGSALLRDLLREWKSRVDAEGLADAAAAACFRELVAADPWRRTLADSPFVQRLLVEL